MTTRSLQTPSAAPRGGRKQRTRERITEAAMEAFRERGYETTTAEQIASSAGISRSNFYLHFKSKAEVVVDMMDALEPQVMAIYAELDKVCDSTPDKIREWVLDTARIWEQDKQRLETLERALAVEPLVAKRWVQTLQHAVEAMSSYLSRFDDGADRDQARAELLTLMFQFDRSMYFAAVGDNGLELPDIREALASQWISVLLRDRPAAR